jgi:hypothetical protein
VCRRVPARRDRRIADARIRTVYAIDYQRGIDVIRWNGPLYVPKK